MKKTARLISLILALILALSLAACGGQNGGNDDEQENTGNPTGGDTGATASDDTDTAGGASAYPALELPDASGLTLAETESGDVQFSYPADKWTQYGDAPMTLYYNDTIEDDAKVNVVVNYETEMEKFSDSDLEEIKGALLDESLSFMTANAAEFRSVGELDVIYIDVVVSDMEAYVDFIIENAGLDNETVEQAGGRDAILEMMPATNQMMMYVIKDGSLFSFTGVYFDETQRDDILELISAALPTLEKA